MLDLLRRHASSWLIKAALFLIVIVFIFWGGYSYKTRQESQMARVGDHYISIADYNQHYNQLLELYRRQLGDSFSEELVRQMNLKKQALNSLIDRYLITKAGSELGLTATSREIQRKLLEFPAFQTEGQFDQKRYVFILRQNRMSPEMFERQMAQELTMQKVQAFIKGSALVTDEEIRSDFLFNNSLLQVAYVLVDPKPLEPQVAVDAKALEEFYQQAQNRYKDPEKRQFSYVLFSLEAFLDGVKVTEGEVKQYYEDHASDYRKEGQVRARHILFELRQDASDSETAKVKQEAQKVLEEARKGRDFEDLARKHSADPTVKENGGDLGFFTREQMVPEFSEVAFNLKPGEISDLVRTPYGFHIIKVEEIRPEEITSFEQAREGIGRMLKYEKARDVAHIKSREFLDAVHAQRDLRKAAQSRNLPVVGSGVWVGQKDLLPGFETAFPQVMSKLFSLQEKDVSEALETDKGFIVAQVDAIQAPQVIPFDQVKERVEKDYRTEQARQQALKKANELLEAARAAGSLEKAAKEKGLEIKQSEWFSRQQPDSNMPALQGDAQNKVFQLQEAQPFVSEPVMVGHRFGVFQLLGRQLPEEKMKAEWDGIRKRLTEEKQATLWQMWMEDQRKKAQIEIYKEL